MKFKVYADTEKGCEGDSIGVREDGQETAVYGRDKESWESAESLIWKAPASWTNDKGELLFEGEY